MGSPEWGLGVPFDPWDLRLSSLGSASASPPSPRLHIPAEGGAGVGPTLPKSAQPLGFATSGAGLTTGTPKPQLGRLLWRSTYPFWFEWGYHSPRRNRGPAPKSQSEGGQMPHPREGCAGGSPPSPPASLPCSMLSRRQLPPNTRINRQWASEGTALHRHGVSLRSQDALLKKAQSEPSLLF